MTVAVRSAGGPFRRVRTTVGALDRWDAAALLGAAVLVMLVFFTFRQYGISNDEEVQNVYGKRLLSFYLSGFADDLAFTYKNLYLYGGLFDMAAVALEAVLPFDPYDTRHLLSGLIGVLGIAGVWLLARRLATPRAAVLAGLLLALTGPWYGGMFNHTKDVPFAAGMVWALYFLCRIIEELPRPQPGRVLVFGVAVGLSLGLRVGGVFSGFYAFLAVLAWSLFVGPQASWRARLAQGALAMRRLIPAAVVAYALMAAFWPWSVFDPLNPIRALSEFSAFQYDVRTIFAGTVYKMYEVPRSYVPVYLAIKLPLAMLVGASAFAWLGIRTGRGCAACRLGLSLTAFAVVFPIAVFVLTDMPAYNGLRHLLFVVPPLAVLAGIGLDNLLVRVRSRRLLAGAVTGALTLHLGSVGSHAGAHASTPICLLQRAGGRPPWSVSRVRAGLLGQYIAGSGGGPDQTAGSRGGGQPRTAADLHGRGVRRSLVLRSHRSALFNLDSGLAGRRLLHRPDPHGLRPRAQG